MTFDEKRRLHSQINIFNWIRIMNCRHENFTLAQTTRSLAGSTRGVSA